MQFRRLFWPVLWLTFFWVGTSPAQTASLSKHTPPHASICGSPVRTGDLTDPPDVDVSQLPVDARGDRELILAVHRDGPRYCYRYPFNGVTETIAPTIRVRAGDTFALRIVNDLAGQSKGESVSAASLPACMPMDMPNAPVHRYTGYLNHTIFDRYMPPGGNDTNIHLHGFQGPPVQENVFLSTLSTPMHACEYRLTIPATQPPGTYFYHPHAHGMSGAQVAFGLTGVWIVEPRKPQISRASEHVLVIRYGLPVKLDWNFVPDTGAIGSAEVARIAKLPPAPPVAYDPFNPPPWPVSYPVRAGAAQLYGTCDGVASEPLVSINQYATPASLPVAGGQMQLLRIVNATSDSPKLLQLLDSSRKIVPMLVAETDGMPISGDLNKPLSSYERVNQLMMAPAGRASILVTVPTGQTLTLRSAHFCEGIDMFYQMPHDLVRLTGVETQADPPALQTQETRGSAGAAALVAYVRLHPHAVKRRAITFTEYSFPKQGKVPAHDAYYVTDTTNRDFHERPYWPEFANGAMAPTNPTITVKRGTIEEWYLINTTMESHTFHIHQMAFAVENGLNGAPALQDSVLLPVGNLLPNPHEPDYPLVKPSIVRVLMDFRNVPRGTFLFHCHMLFHEDRGMMATIQVV